MEGGEDGVSFPPDQGDGGENQGQPEEDGQGLEAGVSARAEGVDVVGRFVRWWDGVGHGGQA